jgi:hypothetical protein
MSCTPTENVSVPLALTSETYLILLVPKTLETVPLVPWVIPPEVNSRVSRSASVTV